MTTTPSCPICHQPLPLDDKGVPIYWHTFAINPDTGIPVSTHICLTCRENSRQQTRVQNHQEPFSGRFMEKGAWKYWQGR